MAIAKRFRERTEKEKWEWRVANARRMIKHYKSWNIPWKADIWKGVLQILLKNGPEPQA